MDKKGAILPSIYEVLKEMQWQMLCDMISGQVCLEVARVGSLLLRVGEEQVETL